MHGYVPIDVALTVSEHRVVDWIRAIYTLKLLSEDKVIHVISRNK